MRVIVAEDDPTFRDVLHAAVHAAGHEPVPFEDGTAALAALRAEVDTGAPVALLTDLALPGAWNGAALSRAAAQRNVPAAIVTARPEIAVVTADPAVTVIAKGASAPDAVLAWLSGLEG